MNIIYHLKLVYRNFINQRPYSFLNLIGLSIGLCITFVALLYVTEETGYDTFHKNSKDIYRLLEKREDRRDPLTDMVTAHIGKELQAEIPEIQEVVRYKFGPSKVNGVRRKNGMYADPEIFEVFTFKFINGSIKSLKEEVYSVVVSEEFALKEFNSTNVIGETITVEGKENINYTIKAVYKNFPKKSTLNPLFILPIKNQIPQKRKGVSILTFQTFLLLAKGMDFKNTNAKFLKKGFQLQPLEEIHLYSEDIASRNNNKGSFKVLISYVLIGTLILFISLLNFMLLYTVITKQRFKEFAIRKVNGLEEFGLLKTILFESVVLSFLSAFIAMILVDFVIPVFNEFTKSSISFKWFSNSQFLISAFALVTVFSFLSGYKLYHYLTNYSAIEFIGKQKVNYKNNFFLKNDAIVVQLVVVSFMLIFSMGYYKQLDFILNSDKGYKPQSVLVLPSLGIDKEVFKEEAVKYPDIEEVAFGPAIPDLHGSTTFSVGLKDNSSKEEYVNMEAFRIDDRYIPLYGISIKEGRNFSKQYSTDKKEAVILNETAVKRLNIVDNPVGKKPTWVLL